ncbi:SDR family NAD(P)-dependent oxidoreductase [Tahibacter caeni]|uniref:SDR family NAD(P)-dependent oxidoreductase n=1 Tax=Tahibacter caeni TaxID=1453545 RepID=UPI0021482629|nr:SDR family NAD(P)-dependent oxidoreductase [Tahibacter caeni]
MATSRSLALVTGASSGIGLELAKLAAQDGHDLVVAADRALADAEQTLRALGAQVIAVETDLATPAGVRQLLDAVGERPVALLFANAGHGLGGAFLDQHPIAIQHVIDTNVSGTVALLHAIGNGMRRAGAGRILITGSIAGFEPGSYQAVYNATKAFVDSFALAIRDELKDTGVTVSCLMPGVTDTEFFERAGLLDTKLGTGKKMDPAEVARIGYDAMLEGEADVVAGWKNKLAVAMANLTPGERLAARHAEMAKPGSARH